MSVAREERARKARLAQVRQNDAAHEAMMQDAARKACVNLADIRGMDRERKDKALLAMFRRARVTQ